MEVVGGHIETLISNVGDVNIWVIDVDGDIVDGSSISPSTVNWTTSGNAISILTKGAPYNVNRYPANITIQSTGFLITGTTFMEISYQWGGIYNGSFVLFSANQEVIFCPVYKGKNGNYLWIQPNISNQGFMVYDDELLGMLNYIAPSSSSLGSAEINATFKFGSASATTDLINKANAFMKGSVSPIPSGDDPYNSGGTSGTGGGGGNFSDQSDEIDFGSTPNISLGSTGLCNAFSPTKAELTELGNYMWGTLNIENYRRIFADPMDVIIGLSAIPISPQLGSKKEVFVGNIGTGLTMSEITRNFVTLACGAVSLDEYWGSYLDYSPSTTVEIYLPFIGYHKLDTNEVMGRQVNLLYQVDVITGSCLAQVMTIDKEGSRKVIATYQGNCGYQLPISGTNWSSMFGSALGMVGTAAIAIGSGGTALPLVAPTLASTALNASKDDITRSGSIGGNPTLGMPKTPYLIITRPNQALPKDQNKYIGYPSFITVSLSELEGYTEFETIHLEGIPATDEELTELETMLKEGVIF